MSKASESFSKLLQTRTLPTSQSFAFTNEIRLPDDDGDALLTICNILHGRNRQVPDSLALEGLKEIARSCNRHQLHCFRNRCGPRCPFDPRRFCPVSVLQAVPYPGSCRCDWNSSHSLCYLARLTKRRRWVSLPKDKSYVESRCGSSKLYVGHVLHITKVY